MYLTRSFRARLWQASACLLFLLAAGVAWADAPVATDANVSTNEDQPLGLTLQGQDADQESLQFSIAGGPSHGSLSCSFGSGCTAHNAINFNPQADTDDGSCRFTSCMEILRANPGAASGSYTIDPDGLGPRGNLSVYCDMNTDGGGYTFYNVDSGLRTYGSSDWDSCKEVGLQMVVPRTKAHWQAMYGRYGSSYFTTVPGISKPFGGGNYTGFPMNSRHVPPNSWRAVDGGSWWLRDTAFTEPNGDYTANCWLSMANHGDPNNLTFNDGSCGYSTVRYVCSTNDKDGPGSPNRPGSCADILRENPNASSGNYTIYRGGSALVAYCDMSTDGGGYTYYPVSGGIRTYRSLDNNSCKQLGMDIVIPRTKAHLQAMLGRYGSGYFATVPGVHKRSNGGNYTGYAMNDNTIPAGGYEATDGGSWWLRDTPYGEPNGDYTAYCWLVMGNHGDPNNLTFNDLNCTYSTVNYICSPNDKDGPVKESHPYSCAEIKKANPSAPSGTYTIQPGVTPVSAYCDMSTDGGGYTYYNISGGKVTSRSTDANSCHDLGMDIAIPRTKAHLQAMLGRYGSGYFSILPGILKPTSGGNYTGYAMKSGSMPAGGYQAMDGGSWWIRDTAYGEPNGDYTANCWLGMLGHDVNNITFNDGNCGYSASSYICSTNDKDGALTPSGEFTSCLDAKNKLGSPPSGLYRIDVDGPKGYHRPVHVYCDMSTDGGGYTLYPVQRGVGTARSTDWDSCRAMGMQMVVPRTKAHFQAMLGRYGTGFFSTVPGISRPYDAGNFSHIPMKYDSAFRNATRRTSEPWAYQAVDGGSWWLRDSTFSEPSGDYSAHCWLGMTGWDPNNFTYNDGGCGYTTSRYLCSTNDKDGHADFPDPGAAPPKTTLACTYTPTTGYSGADSFTFRVIDPQGEQDIGQVNITVINANQAPSAQSQSVSVNEDGSVGVTLSGTDPDGDALSYAITGQPAHGALSCAGRACTYTPAANYNGADSFTFRVNDGQLNSNTATVSLNVVAVNDAPTANSASASVGEDGSAAITLSGGDVEGNGLTYTILTQPAHGALSCTGNACTYTPATNYHGADSFTFRTNDGALNSNTATVSLTVTAVNDAPVASNGSVLAAEDSPVMFTLSASDVDGDALTWAILTQPAHGALGCTGNACTYTPAANYHGADSFTFRSNDGALNSNTATVSLTVQAINDAPVTSNSNVSTNEDQAVAVTLSATDVDGDALTWTILAQPSRGTLSGTAPNLTYTPANNFGGGDSFTFRVSDGQVSSNVSTVSITVSAVNDAPVALPQSVGLNEDNAANITLAATDAEGDALTYTVLTQPAHGALGCTGNACTYTPAANYHGADSFTFRVNDGALNSNTASVSLNVVAVNDAPVTSDVSRTITDGQGVSVTLVGTDVDMDLLTWQINDAPEHGTLSGTAPNLTYTPTVGYAGMDHFTFTVSDGQAQASGTATFAVSDQTLDPPVVTLQTQSTWQSGMVALEAMVTDSSCLVAPSAALTPAVATATVSPTMGGWSISSGALPQDRYALTLTVTSACSGKSANGSVTFGVDSSGPTLIVQDADIRQNGVDPMDEQTWPSVSDLDTINLGVLVQDQPAPRVSGDASATALVRELDNGDNEIALASVSFNAPVGTPPTGPAVAPAQLCQEMTHCENNALSLAGLSGDRFLLLLTATDVAGNTSTRSYYLRRARLRPTLVAWINAVDAQTGDTPQAEAERQAVAQKLARGLLALDEEAYGNLLLALEDAYARMRVARQLDNQLDSGPQADATARVAYSFYRQQLQARVGQHGAMDAFQEAGDQLEVARLNLLSDATGDALLAMANAWFWMTQGADPLVASDFGTSLDTIRAIISQMDAYITHDPALPGQLELAQARTTLGAVEELIDRVVQQGDRSLSDLEHVQLLLGLTDTAEFLKDSEEQTTWVRNWQWGLTQIVYIYAARGLRNAAGFLGDGSSILRDGQAQLDLALELRQQFKADDFMNLLIDSRCLILGLYNAAYDPDETVPSVCCADIIRYHDLEPAVPVPNHCQ